MDGLRPYFKESIDVGGRNLCAMVKKVCKLKLSFAVEGSPISRLGCFSGRWWRACGKELPCRSHGSADRWLRLSENAQEF